MREGIQRLVALPKPPKVSKAHHFDGLVTWESSEQNGELDPGFRYRASSIWRLVTRDLYIGSEDLVMCRIQYRNL